MVWRTGRYLISTLTKAIPARTLTVRLFVLNWYDCALIIDIVHSVAKLLACFAESSRDSCTIQVLKWKEKAPRNDYSPARLLIVKWCYSPKHGRCITIRMEIQFGAAYFSLRVKNHPSAPIWTGSLSGYDSRLRHVIHVDGSKEIYRFKRLRCQGCRKLHVELRDCMQPYKHHSARIIEAE